MCIKKIFLFIVVIFSNGAYADLLFARSSLTQEKFSKKVTILGAGYVGLITAAGLAHLGHKVICADNDTHKIVLLQQNIMTIYEPGLHQLVWQTMQTGNLEFTSDIEKAIRESEYIFIAVGTPMGANGCADLSAVYKAFSMIVPFLGEQYKIICIKSTVPIGTGKSLLKILQGHSIDATHYNLVSNPEFLREGSAINDFFSPDRIVLGIGCPRAIQEMQELYYPLLSKQVPCVITNWATAETIKYASNAFLATKISFINEIANLCDTTGADVEDVAFAMGLDKRIGKHFLKPGPGFGGSCFPKDCNALVHIAKDYKVDLNIVSATLLANEIQQDKPVQKLLTLMNGNIKDKTIAVLGLAFKGNTDDVRSSPAIRTIELLLQNAAHIKAYDPVAMKNMQAIFPALEYQVSLYEAVQDADAVIIMTEWDEFKNIDIAKLAGIMKQRIIVDARNLLDPVELQKNEFLYAMMGRP